MMIITNVIKIRLLKLKIVDRNIWLYSITQVRTYHIYTTDEVYQLIEYSTTHENENYLNFIINWYFYPIHLKYV